MPFPIWLFAAGTLAVGSSAQNDPAPERNIHGQITREGSFELETHADKAIWFFTPEGERAWVDGWDPRPVYPAQRDVAFQTNAVFRLDHDEDHSIWTIVEANSREHIAEYVYFVQSERMSRVRVWIERLTDSRCRVHVRYVHTATSEKGSHFLASVTEEAYAQKMADWRRMVSAVIR